MFRRLATRIAPAMAVLSLFVPGSSATAAPSPSPLDTVNVQESGGFVFDLVNITAQASPTGQNVSGTATVSLRGAFAVSGPVTCLSVTGPDQGGGTPSAPTTATLNFQDPRGVLTARIVDNGGQSSNPDEIQVFAGGRAPTDCSPLAPGFGIDELLTAGRAVVFDAPLVPTSKDQCKDGGWRSFGTMFRNQGQCVAFVERGAGPH